MKRLFEIVVSTALGIALLHAFPDTSAGAQTTTVAGEMKVVTGTVEKIDFKARTLVVKTATDYEEIDVPEGVKRFALVKVGDRLTLRYYDNIVLILKKPGDSEVDSQTAAITPGVTGTTGTTARQRTITATITAIDERAPSVTFTGPNSWTFSSPVKDRDALARVHVGDRVDLTWTSAVLVSLEPAPQ
jgi:hypothetical protein